MISDKEFKEYQKSVNFALQIMTDRISILKDDNQSMRKQLFKVVKQVDKHVDVLKVF